MGLLLTYKGRLMINYVESLAFDDLMLIPKYSMIRSRSEVDLSVGFFKGFKFSFPFVPSNMKTITELAMAKLMYQYKSLAIFHRFTEFDNQVKWLKEINTWGKDATKFIGFSVGVKEEDKERIDILVGEGAKIICIDIAHGDSVQGLQMTNWVAVNYPKVLLISGNVAMGEGATRVWEAGADIVKVGIGAGSICLTRINTGNGVPSMTSLSECYDAKKYMEVKLGRQLGIMNDGGCKTPGDIVKALCFADLTMCGNLFAGSSETPGEIIVGTYKKYKEYVGSSTHRGTYSEGVEATVEYKGETSSVIQSISEGVRSGLSYQGAYNLQELKKNPKFVKITTAGMQESHAHDVIV
jgi:IMP dehydrogenase